MYDPDQGYPTRTADPHEKKTALSVRSDLPGKPALVNRELDYQVPANVWSTWTPQNGQRALCRELTVEERAICEYRAREFKLGLLPFTADQRNAVDSALSRMLGGFNRHLDVGSFVEVMLDLLREFPAWAILDGCTKITHDQHGLNPPFNPNFGPTDNQVCQVVAGVVAPYRQKLARVQNLLSAPVEEKSEDIAPRQTWEEAKAELRQRGMEFGDEPKSVETAETIMKRHGISQEQWDAIPDLPKK